MPNIITPNMSLVEPTVGQELSPTWALELNQNWSTVDQHDHTPGNGVQIPVAGLNIDADLPLNSNNIVTVRSVRFDPQGSPLSLGTDLGCIYEAGVDLYYNDGNGNQVRITQGGSIAGATGSISGLVPPASASYSPGLQKFIWQSAVNTAASMDAGSYIMRRIAAGSNSITLQPPGALPANYAITFPSSLPAFLSILQVNSSGVLSTGPASLPAVTSNLAIDNAGNISTGTAVAVSINQGTAISGNSSGSGLMHLPGGDAVLTVTGRPVMLMIVGDTLGTGDCGFGSYNAPWSGLPPLFKIGYDGGNHIPISILPDGVTVGRSYSITGCAVLTGIPAGSHTFELYCNPQANDIHYEKISLIVYEL